MQRLLLGGALHVGRPARAARTRRRSRGGRAARLLGMLGGDDRDRLAEVAHAVDREHRLVGELEPVGLLPGTSSCVSTACTPGMRERRREVSIATMRACACGLRSVCPRASRPRCRSLEYANSPVTFGTASCGATASPTRPSSSSAGGRRRHAPGRQPRRRRRSSRSRCSGRGCPRAPRGSRRRSGSATRSSSSAVATTRPGVQKPHCTAPASTNASLHAVQPLAVPRAPRPSPPRARRPAPRARGTRRRASPSSSTEHEPHSPCSHAFFEPGRPSRSRSA